MKNSSDVVKEYPLSGDGVVRVYKPFGNEKYIAVVEQHGRYPEAGKTARNHGRSEFSVIISGTFEYCVDGVQTTLKEKDHILVGDGQRYSIEGNGKALVFVTDREGGATLIE
ncbi:MAG: hypothetical protein J0M12_15440 [Deltaproteobacteria bacterium]|nr:hypothetical protein [Deltaproteobacteria bacterium]